MANRQTTKTKFETGDKPTQAEFAELMDSIYFKEDDNLLASLTAAYSHYLVSKLALKSDINHTHANYALQADLVAGLNGKANADHSHYIENLMFFGLEFQSYNENIITVSLSYFISADRLRGGSIILINGGEYHYITSFAVIDETVELTLNSNIEAPEIDNIAYSSPTEYNIIKTVTYDKSEVENLISSSSVQETLQATIETPASTESSKYVSVRRFWNGITQLLSQVNTWVLKQTFSTSPRINSITASLPLKVNATNDVISATIDTNDITNHAVTFAKMQEIPTMTFLGNIAAITANPTAVESVEMFVGVPANSSAAGLLGQFSYDANYFYYHNDTRWHRISNDLTIW